jgi:hypothetical protein
MLGALLGKDTGLERCSNTMRHRPRAVACASLLPRPDDSVSRLKRYVPEVFEFPRDETERPAGASATAIATRNGRQSRSRVDSLHPDVDLVRAQDVPSSRAVGTSRARQPGKT